MPRYVTEPLDPRERFGLYRLCDCPTCEGSGKGPEAAWPFRVEDGNVRRVRCPDCRGEGRIRQEVVSTETEEGVGVALVTCGREGEWEGCAFGLLDRMPECAECEESGKRLRAGAYAPCRDCKGSGVKPTGTWLLLPWLPSPRNVSDAGKLLRSRRST